MAVEAKLTTIPQVGSPGRSGWTARRRIFVPSVPSPPVPPIQAAKTRGSLRKRATTSGGRNHHGAEAVAHRRPEALGAGSNRADRVRAVRTLSLVIDIGAARLSQGQMQNAADAAALEGLRKRDVGLRNPVDAVSLSTIPFASDCLRRAAANRMVRWTFDDDFEPANGDAGSQLGAGPVLDVTEGATTLHAVQTISVPEPRVYKPDPQLNQQNQVYGDMVSGRFCYTADPVPSEGEPLRSAGHRVHRAAARQRRVCEKRFQPEPDVARASACAERMSGASMNRCLSPGRFGWIRIAVDGDTTARSLFGCAAPNDFAGRWQARWNRTSARADRHCR